MNAKQKSHLFYPLWVTNSHLRPLRGGLNKAVSLCCDTMTVQTSWYNVEWKQQQQQNHVYFTPCGRPPIIQDHREVVFIERFHCSVNLWQYNQAGTVLNRNEDLKCKTTKRWSLKIGTTVQWICDKTFKRYNAEWKQSASMRWCCTRSEPTGTHHPCNST